MFARDPSPSFKTLVGGFVPGGTPRDGVTVEYRHKTRSEYNTWIDGLGDKPLIDALMDVVVGWEGAPLPWSREALAELDDKYPALCAALFRAYGRGLFEAREKN